MLLSQLGMLETYGLRRVMSQGYEKLVLDPKRYTQIHGQDELSTAPYPRVPQMFGKGSKTILLVTRSFYPDCAGGTERFAGNLASALKSAGNQVFLLSYSARVHWAYSKQYFGILYSEESIDGLSVIRFRHQKARGEGLKNIEREDPALQAFAQFIFSKVCPDVVHFLHLSRVSAMVGACLNQGIPYFVTVTDFFVLCHSSTRVDRTGQICGGCEGGKRCAKVCPTSSVKNTSARYENALNLLKAAERVIAPSGYTAGVLQREFPGLEVTVIPQGIWTAPTKRTQCGTLRRFLFVGRLSEVKGICGLICAFRNMPEDCTLQIYGDGPAGYRNKLRRLAAKDERITFHSAVSPEKVDEVYRRADCVVVPSLVPETYNFVVREALQNSCLVVASAVGAMPEAVSEGKNGFLVPCGKEQALLEGLMKAYRFSWENYLETEPYSTEDEAASYSYLYKQIERK